MIAFTYSVGFGQNKIGGRDILKGKWKGKNIEYIDQQILVGIKAGYKSSELSDYLNQRNITIVKDIRPIKVMLVDVDPEKDIFKEIEVLNGLAFVKFAEPNGVVHTAENPNDPYYAGTTPASYAHHWSYNNTGQPPPSGTSDADIDAPEAWSIETGDSNVLVAVLDSGLPLDGSGDLCHPDLDNTNRYFLGPDLIDSPADGIKDKLGHGTHVTGTIAAETNNSIGVAGVDWNCTILAIQIFNQYGSGSYSSMANGIIAAVDSGAAIINLSGGGANANSTLESAVKYADSVGVLQVYATHNYGSTYGTFYPARYAHISNDTEYSGYPNGYPSVISVAATDHNDNRSSYSSYTSGSYHVSVAAPGGYGYPYGTNDIFSTMPNYTVTLNSSGIDTTYGYMAGTSMAAPHVAGTAALILSNDNTLTAEEVRDILEESADDVNSSSSPGLDQYLGYGRINAYRAVLCAEYEIAECVTGSLSGTISQNTLLYDSVSVSSNITANSNITILVEVGTVLEIDAGIDLSFSSGSELIVYGSIDADGTPANHITFDFTGAGTHWDGIKLKPGASANFDYCDIDNAVVGIHCDNVSPSITNTDITDCSYYGILTVGNSDLNLSGCEITGNGIWGVFIDETAGMTSDYVLFDDNGASAPFDGGGVFCEGESEFRYCQISSNDSFGVYIEEDGFADLGLDAEDGYGYNNIGSNVEYEIESYSTETTEAYWNYWGSSDGPDENKLYGDIEYDPYFEDDPEELPWSLPKVLTKPNIAEDKQLYFQGKKYYSDKDYSNAVEVFQILLDKYPDSFFTKFALQKMVVIKTRTDNGDEIVSFLSDKKETCKSDKLRNNVNMLLVHELRKNKQYADALELTDYDYVDEKCDAYMKMMKGYILLHDLQNTPGAKAAMDDFLLAYPNSIYSANIYMELNQLLGVKPKWQKGESEVVLEDESFNVATYPNPFNPISTLSFSIPEICDVSLVVYDLLGREVITLLNEQMNSGTHNSVWNGKDQFGSPVSTGMYIYRLSAKSRESDKSYTTSQKIVMLK